MQTIALWQISGTTLTRVTPSQIDLERSLEEWIERDPSLIQKDLVIVGRQLTTEAGRLDLLGIDPQGRWTVIEIKRGALTRETIAQALDYASVIATMAESEIRDLLHGQLTSRQLSLDEILKQRDATDSLDPSQRDVSLVVVGTGRSPGLERVSSFLGTRYGVPLTIVSFDVFELGDGSGVLAREVSEADTQAQAKPRGPSVTSPEVVDLARTYPTGISFEKIYAAATGLGLHPRPYKTSIMYTSPEYRSQMLFTVWARPDRNLLKMALSLESFTEFFPTSVEEVERHLGPDGYRWMSDTEALHFISGLEALFELMSNRSSPPPTEGV